MSYVLNGRKDVAIPDETRNKVFEAAEELGYKPNIFARSLIKGISPYVGVVVFRLSNSAAAEFISGVQEVCHDHGYGVLVACSKYDLAVEREEVELLRQQAAAIVAWPVEPVDVNSHCIWSQAARHLPICLCTEPHGSNPGIDFVTTDNFACGFLSTEHLIGLGHKRIAHIRGLMNASANIRRAEGYEAALAKHGIAASAELVAGNSYEGQGTEEVIDQLLALKDRPTAIVCANDYIAAEAILALRTRGVQVPDEIAVAGVGNVDLAKYLQLTTTESYHERMGREAAKMALARIADPHLAVQVDRGSVELIVRESTKARTPARV